MGATKLIAAGVDIRTVADGWVMAAGNHHPARLLRVYQRSEPARCQFARRPVAEAASRELTCKAEGRSTAS